MQYLLAFCVVFGFAKKLFWFAGIDNNFSIRLKSKLITRL